MRFDSSKLTYDIKKVETADRTQSKFKLVNIRFDGLKVDEDEVHSTAEFICKNQLNAHSLDMEGEVDYAENGTIVYVIDLDSDAKNKVPMVYKAHSDLLTLTLKSVTCSMRIYQSLDEFQL